MEATCFWWSSASLLVIQLFASALEMDKTEYDSQHVTCSKAGFQQELHIPMQASALQGLSNCTLKDINLLNEECPVTDLGLKVEPGLKVKSVLCCSRGTKCQPCLHVHIDLQPRNHQTVSYVVVCHRVPQATLPLCRKLEFTVTPAALEREGQYSQWLSLLLMDELVTFNSQVTVNVCSQQYSVYLPSKEEVCSSEKLQAIVEECHVPRFNIWFDQERREMMIQVEKEEDSPFPLEMCLQHEKNGVCKPWKKKTIQLHSVTPCMCFQVWWDKGDNDRSHRAQICPFTNNTEWFQRNVWDNVSVSVVQGQMNSGGTMLSWNLTAPCRLEGAAWLCQRDAVLDKDRCNKLKGHEQPMQNDTWKENDKYWLFPGVFENINTGLDLCVMVTVKNREFGPFCPTDTSWWHWRWSLLVLVSLILFGLAAICLYFLHGKLKRLAWQWHQRKCNQFDRGRVVLLSPPDTNTSVSELMCRLGSTLSAWGHSVSVDMWSRAELCSLGPLPWLHSQLQPPDSQRGRAILVLTRSARQKAEEWAQQLDRQGRGMDQGEQGAERVEGEGEGLLRDLSSPYADVFSAALSCVEADRQQGRAGERFLLVQFEAHPAMPHGGKRGPPQLFQGLPVFNLPSQTQALFSALAMGPR